MEAFAIGMVLSAVVAVIFSAGCYAGMALQRAIDKPYEPKKDKAR